MQQHKKPSGPGPKARVEKPAANAGDAQDRLGNAALAEGLPSSAEEESTLLEEPATGRGAQDLAVSGTKPGKNKGKDQIKGPVQRPGDADEGTGGGDDEP